MIRYHSILIVLFGATVCVGGSSVGAQSPAPAIHVIGQRGSQFNPPTLTVRKGDILVFMNDDNKAHHVVSHTPLQTFDLDLLQPGAEARQVMDRAGEVVIGCDVHPRMETVVTVVE